MRYLPIWLDVKDKDCLMVGGGEVAARKAEMILKSGARLTVVAPKLGVNLQRLVDAGAVQHLARVFQVDDLQGKRLVVAATDIEAVNQVVHSAAQAQNVLINVVDSPAQCDYVNGAVVERENLTIAISSGGGAPVLTRVIKAKLETMIPAAYGSLSALVTAYREEVKAKLGFKQRRGFWERVLDGPVAEAALSGQSQRAEALLQEEIQRGAEEPDIGEVFLVGAGPGDPDLLTFKALRLLQKADVVVHDRLIAEPIMDLCRREAERIYVGKLSADHSVPQEEISQMLVDLAKQGKKVARLKGGDPFMFGRGGEEIALLAEHNIPFQVVPGVTSATGCSSYAGIPLTHRDHAQACVFVTGHTKDDKLDHLNWHQLAQPQQTVVFYMGLKNVAEICQRLQEAGAPANRPAALIEQGTTPQQRVLVGDLESLAGMVKEHNIKPPSLIMVGDVISLQDKLGWYQGQVSNADNVQKSAFPFRHKLD